MKIKPSEPARAACIFWPKWQVKVDNKTVYPAVFGGVHLGTVAEGQASGKKTDKPGPRARQRRFHPRLDMLFIDAYVFEHCERPDVQIGFEPGGGVPGSLGAVERVAISAGSLLCGGRDGMWLKKLRFILHNFPRVRAINVLTAVVLDMAAPASLPGSPPVCFMDVANTSAHDRARLGILVGDELPSCPASPDAPLRPADLAVREWDGLPREWPMFARRKADGTAPELYMGTMVFFAREWVSLEGVGAPGPLCSLGARSADPVGAIVRRERDKMANKGQARTGAPGGRGLEKKRSMFSLTTKGSGLSLLRKASTFSMRS